MLVRSNAVAKGQVLTAFFPSRPRGNAFHAFSRSIAGVNVLVENFDKLGDNAVAFQRRHQPSVDKDRRFGFLEGAGKRNADVGVFGFARAVDYASHYRQLKLLYAWILFFPYWHVGA